jgi:hypothetical protein
LAKINDLISRAGADNGQAGVGANIWFGTVMPPAPATLGDNLYVDIPDISFISQVKFGPCRWDKHMLPVVAGVQALPQVDDEVLVIFDNRQQPWVVGIWQ